MSKKRKEVVKSIEEAVAQIKDGQTVAIGGFGADNHPMAIVREMIRTGKKNLTIIASATAGLEIDLRQSGRRVRPAARLETGVSPVRDDGVGLSR